MNVFTNNADFYPTPVEVINTMMMERTLSVRQSLNHLQARGTL